MVALDLYICHIASRDHSLEAEAITSEQCLSERCGKCGCRAPDFGLWLF